LCPIRSNRGAIIHQSVRVYNTSEKKNLFDFKVGFAFLKDCIDAERICLRKLISICGDHISFEADSKRLIHCVN